MQVSRWLCAADTQLGYQSFGVDRADHQQVLLPVTAVDLLTLLSWGLWGSVTAHRRSKRAWKKILQAPAPSWSSGA